MDEAKKASIILKAILMDAVQRALLKSTNFGYSLYSQALTVFSANSYGNSLDAFVSRVSAGYQVGLGKVYRVKEDGTEHTTLHVSGPYDVYNMPVHNGIFLPPPTIPGIKKLEGAQDCTIGKMEEIVDCSVILKHEKQYDSGSLPTCPRFVLRSVHPEVMGWDARLQEWAVESLKGMYGKAAEPRKPGRLPVFTRKGPYGICKDKEPVVLGRSYPLKDTAKDLPVSTVLYIYQKVVVEGDTSLFYLGHAWDPDGGHLRVSTSAVGLCMSGTLEASAKEKRTGSLDLLAYQENLVAVTRLLPVAIAGLLADIPMDDPILVRMAEPTGQWIVNLINYGSSVRSTPINETLTRLAAAHGKEASKFMDYVALEGTLFTVALVHTRWAKIFEQKGIDITDKKSLLWKLHDRLMSDAEFAGALTIAFSPMGGEYYWSPDKAKMLFDKKAPERSHPLSVLGRLALSVQGTDGLDKVLKNALNRIKS